jgi:hypothetical protein
LARESIEMHLPTPQAFIALAFVSSLASAQQQPSTLSRDIEQEQLELKQKQEAELSDPKLTEAQREQLRALHAAQRQAQEQLQSRQLQIQRQSSSPGDTRPQEERAARGAMQSQQFERDRQSQQLQFEIQQQQRQYQLRKP